jgi:hypothetical protein
VLRQDYSSPSTCPPWQVLQPGRYRHPLEAEAAGLLDCQTLGTKPYHACGLQQVDPATSRFIRRYYISASSPSVLISYGQTLYLCESLTSSTVLLLFSPTLLRAGAATLLLPSYLYLCRITKPLLFPTIVTSKTVSIARVVKRYAERTATNAIAYGPPHDLKA